MANQRWADSDLCPKAMQMPSFIIGKRFMYASFLKEKKPVSELTTSNKMEVNRTVNRTKTTLNRNRSRTTCFEGKPEDTNWG
jgi:hypothetical protein